MEHIKKIPLVLFCLFSLKLLVFQASWQDVALVAFSAALYALEQYKMEQKRIIELEDRLNALHKSVEEAKTGVASLRMTTGLKVNVAR